MKTFPYVEDYLEVINGDRDPGSGKIYGLFDSTKPIVSLARYDVSVLASMSSATQSGRALTDRQAELAVKIISKYRKQLEKLDIDVGPIESPKYRLGIRDIDRRRLLYLDDGYAILKFPYETKLIDCIRDLSKLSHGSWKFDASNKAWKIALTETSVIAAHGFAKNNDFEIDEKFDFYVQKVLECESVPHEIKLVRTNQAYTITNAADSLIKYINNWCGFHDSNVDLLVDCSAILGYTVDDTIQQDIAKKYSSRICSLMSAQEIKFDPASEGAVYRDLVKYAEITGRYPIYVYEPDMSNRLYKNFVEQHFHPDDVHQVKHLKPDAAAAHKKVIYFNKYTAQWDQPVPLLVSGQGMMHGGEKTMLLQRAEKVVYFATEVYNIKTMMQRQK